MAKTVEIIIDPKTGKLEFEVNGVVGESCTDITDVLTRGHEVEDSQLTEEYYTPAEEPAYVGE
jgi:hypothetical protein